MTLELDNWACESSRELGGTPLRLGSGLGLSDAFYQACLLATGAIAIIVSSRLELKIINVLSTVVFVLIFGILHYVLIFWAFHEFVIANPWVRKLGIALLTLGFYSVPVLWDYTKITGSVVEPLVGLNPYFHLFVFVDQAMLGVLMPSAAITVACFLGVIALFALLANRKLGGFARSDERVRAKDLRIKLGKKIDLGPINFDARPGEITLLHGKNGAGKSTWLRVLVGQIRVYSGHVMAPSNQDPSCILDNSPHLVPWSLSVRDEQVLRLKLLGFFGNELRGALEQCDRLCKVRDIDGGTRMSALSSGQRFFARWTVYTVAMPKWFLCDEWFSTLDKAGREEFETGLEMLIRRGCIVIVATAEPTAFENMRPRVIAL